VLAARIAGPVRRLEATARQVAAGDLDARTVPEGSAEQRSLAHSVNAMTERLGALLARQRRFVADASHQLRTPLTGLRLRLENLRAGAGDDAGAAAELDAALVEVDRLSAIVADLLELSRAERGGTTAAAEDDRVDAAAAARRAAERWAPQAAAHGTRLLVDAAAAGLEPAPWSAAALDRMLDALVENALVHGGAGGTVRIVAGPAFVAVEDDGPGLDPVERERAFERFHRGRAAEAGTPGTGLGLAIVRELAEGGGGRASLAERPGGGTVARLDFRAAREVLA
jgi:signal transduction histidine kinase